MEAWRSLPRFGVVLCLFLSAKIALAEQVVEEIHIEGLRRTQPFVVERELEFNIGEAAKTEDLEESVRRLRNLGVFSTAEYDANNTGVTVSVQERWTTIPIFKINQGGGLTQLVLGAFDVNSFGRYLELGAQYERLGESNSGVVWFRDPRFLNQRLRFGADFWSVNRPQILYGDSGDIEGGFLLQRKMASFEMEKEITPWFTAGMNFRLLNDSFSTQFLSSKILEAQADQPLPEDGRAVIFGGLFGLGRLDMNNYLVDGLLWSNAVYVAPKVGIFDTGFETLSGEVAYFRTLPFRSTFGARVLYGVTNARAEQHQFFIGGLDRVRGFYDDRIRGRKHVTGNVEYRIPSLDRQALVIQHVAFLDATRVGEGNLAAGQSAASAGIGLRLLSPKIYRLTLRFDFAFPLLNHTDAAFSFSAQQFF
jgi:outer membrane protein assembly factor BamA